MDARKARASARKKQQQRKQLQRERASHQQQRQQLQQLRRQMDSQLSQQLQRQMASQEHQQLQRQMASQQPQQLQRQMASQEHQQLQRQMASQQPHQLQRQMASQQPQQLQRQMASREHQQLQRQMAPHMYMAIHDAFMVCHPDRERPFASLEDACERLLPYHVVRDYQMEEDEKLLDSSATGGQVLSHQQQLDNIISKELGQLTSIFERQVNSFNMITRKRALGDMRTEENLMLEKLLLREKQQDFLESRGEKARREMHEATSSMMFGSPLVGQHRGFGNVNKDDKEPMDDHLNGNGSEKGGKLDLNAW